MSVRAFGPRPITGGQEQQTQQRHSPEQRKPA
jgi:hypothetical protein